MPVKRSFALAIAARSSGDGRARFRPPAEGRPPLPGVPARQRLEPARRRAAGRAELRASSCGASASAPTSTPTSAPEPGRVRRSGFPTSRSPAHQRKVPVSFDYADESDRGPYPIPPNVPIEGGRGSDGDRHVIVVDRARCRAYELYAARPVNGGKRWRAGSGAIWNLRSNRLRPEAVDVGRRRRAPDPARTGPLRGGAPGRDRPRASLHGLAHAASVHLSRPSLRVELGRSRAPTYGAAGAPQGELRRLAASRASHA